jgi:hypothetical protein
MQPQWTVRDPESAICSPAVRSFKGEFDFSDGPKLALALLPITETLKTLFLIRCSIHRVLQSQQHQQQQQQLMSGAC